MSDSTPDDEGGGCGNHPPAAPTRRRHGGVRVRVRGDEIVIELLPRRGTARRRPRVVVDDAEIPGADDAPAEPATRGPARGATRGRAPSRAPTLPVAARPYVGFARAPADPCDGGFRGFDVRADLADSLRVVHQQARALGGVVTSSGGLRDLREPATAGRSRTSLHYTGRAVDLFVESGMHRATDPYLVRRAGGSDDHPEWEVLCVSDAPVTTDPLYDAALIVEGTVDCLRWTRGAGVAVHPRRARYFSLTKLFTRQGWLPIPARADWRTNYLSCEWWHFQNERGLIQRRSLFGDELRRAWAPRLVERSGLALDAVWSGRSFRTGVAAVAPPTPSAARDADEKVRWAQVVLAAAAGEPLVADGDAGPRTTAALQRFQLRNALQVHGEIDASTEAALVQRALERLGAPPFPRVGALDDVTVRAVERFQRAHGLGADGRVGPKTRAALTAALVAITAPEPRRTRPARRRSRSPTEKAVDKRRR